MSQRNVEQVIGRLVTDEGFRRRFAADRRAVIGELVETGLKLNACEARALVTLDPERIARFAAAIHPCIQKVELPGTGEAGAERGGQTAVERAAVERAGVENGPRRSTTDRNDAGDRDPDTEALPLGETP